MEGRFYPSGKRKIFDQIRAIDRSGRYPVPEIIPGQIFGAVLPHAGHVYSGYQTAPFFQLLKKTDYYPETFVIVHPNHSGQGLPLAVSDADFWSNSIGAVPMDREFANLLKLPFSVQAHAREHSAEVIIPFLQYYLADHAFSILPVCMMDQSYESAVRIAGGIHKAVKHTGRKIMVIASCDFSHFLTPEEGQSLDQLVLDKIFGRNPEEVERVVIKNRVSVCGYGPIMTLMVYAAMQHPDYKVRILARGHSGEVSPSTEVVDYISMIIYQ